MSLIASHPGAAFMLLQQLIVLLSRWCPAVAYPSGIAFAAVTQCTRDTYGRVMVICRTRWLVCLTARRSFRCRHIDPDGPQPWRSMRAVLSVVVICQLGSCSSAAVLDTFRRWYPCGGSSRAGRPFRIVVAAKRVRPRNMGLRGRAGRRCTSRPGAAAAFVQNRGAAALQASFSLSHPRLNYSSQSSARSAPAFGCR